MKYLRSLPYEHRLDWCLFQYSARKHRIIDYATQSVRMPDGRVLYRSRLEHCPECVDPSTSLSHLLEHYETPCHITRVAQVELDDFQNYQNSARHDALRYVVEVYKHHVKRPILATATVESVLRALNDDIECDAHQLITSQLEALIGVLQRNAPELFQQREHFWIMRLLGSVRD